MSTGNDHSVDRQLWEPAARGWPHEERSLQAVWSNAIVCACAGDVLRLTVHLDCGLTGRCALQIPSPGPEEQFLSVGRTRGARSRAVAMCSMSCSAAPCMSVRLRDCGRSLSRVEMRPTAERLSGESG